MKYKKKTLDNGLRIITVPMKGNPTVTVLVMVEAGSKYETKANNGISHFLEHMVFKGTTKRPGKVISRNLDGLGAESNAYTAQEYTGYYAKGQKKHFKKFIDVVADAYLDPVFPEDAIEKERGVIIGEIDMYEDMPRFVVYEEFQKLLYGDQPAGMDILGPKENIRKFQRKDFITYRQQHYVPSATTFVVVGDVPARQVFKEVEKHFKHMPSGKKGAKKKTVEKQSKPAIRLRYKKTDQAHLVLGVRSVTREHKDSAVISVLAGLLGKGFSSRLFEKMRDDLGLGYYVDVDQDSFTDTGTTVVGAGVDPKRIDEAIQVIMSELGRLLVEFVPEKEIKKAKEYIIGGMMMQLESSSVQADWYAVESTLSSKMRTPQDKIKAIKAVTPADLKRVAKKIFQDKNLNLAIVGPYKDEKRFKKILTFKL